MKGIFITGTDTNVGKTYVACKIAVQLIKKNINVIPRKPVESGCKKINDTLLPDDALKLQQASQSNETLETICPYRFQQAISPARAAQLTHQKITLKQLTQTCTKQKNENGFLLVEGAGGFYSPICENALNADLAKKLKLPILLVAEDRIGCINQILLSLDAIAKYQLDIKAIVLNNPKPHINTLSSFNELSAYTDIPIIQINTEQSLDALIQLYI